jgi:hypothetical protein
MATSSCPWVEGRLRVEATAHGDGTAFDVHQDLAVGLRQRIFPRCTMRAPLSEFGRAVRRIPAMVRPLEVESTAERLVLSASSDSRRPGARSPRLTRKASALLLAPATPGRAFAPKGAKVSRKK